MSQSENGLCWWRANEKQGPVEKPKARQKNAKPSTERGEQGVEFYTAAVEAQACGAQVLLGDRDFEVHLFVKMSPKNWKYPCRQVTRIRFGMENVFLRQICFAQRV